MPHLKAVYFLRPTAENVRLLQKEFKEPKYGEYHVFFSNLTRDGHIQALAESDEHEVVQQVQEYYADFLAIHQEIFTLNVPSVVGLGGDAHADEVTCLDVAWGSGGALVSGGRALRGLCRGTGRTVLVSLYEIETVEQVSSDEKPGAEKDRKGVDHGQRRLRQVGRAEGK